MATKKIQATRNYKLFTHSDDNRPTDLKAHRKLAESMRTYGFLQSFPIVVVRGRNGLLVIKDGQHRFAIAESLGLPVYYVEEDVDFDVAGVNLTTKLWSLKDYAQKFASKGQAGYVEAVAFAEKYKLPLGTAFLLLSGQSSLSHATDRVKDGSFEVRDRWWGEKVVATYVPLVGMNRQMKNNRFLEACMAACRVPKFDEVRLIRNAQRCREKLVPYSTRDAYLDMLEDVYNFGMKNLVGLKALATMAMRDRNPAARGKSATDSQEAA